MSRLIVILGPTAGGKSELAVALAERLATSGPGAGGDGGDAAVIGADSMQVYRHLDAGTAKPDAALRQRVRHHLIDVVEPTQRFTVADWLALAEPIIDGLLTTSGGEGGGWPIVVGGTNLYIKALLEGMFEGPEADPDMRAELAQLPNDQLHARLAAVDPASAARIHINDTKKLIRAIEVFELTGTPISAAQTQWREEGYGVSGMGYRRNPILIGLDWPIEAINRRINARVKEMFFPDPRSPEHPNPEPLCDEVRRLEAAGLLGPQAREALGYKQVLHALAGHCSMDDAFEQTKIQTRRFAKRQRTWLKRFGGVYWLAMTDTPAPDAAALAETIIRRAVQS